MEIRVKALISVNLVMLKGPFQGRPSAIKSSIDLYTFVVESRPHIGADQWERRHSGGRQIVSSIIKNVNWLAVYMLVTTVQWKDKQHWSSDQLIGHANLFFFVVTLLSAVFSSQQHDSSARGTGPLVFRIMNILTVQYHCILVLNGWLNGKAVEITV